MYLLLFLFIQEIFILSLRNKCVQSIPGGLTERKKQEKSKAQVLIHLHVFLPGTVNNTTSSIRVTCNFV